jgi:BON domain
MKNVIHKIVILSAFLGSATLIADNGPLNPRYTYNTQLDRPVNKPTADNANTSYGSTYNGYDSYTTNGYGSTGYGASNAGLGSSNSNGMNSNNGYGNGSMSGSMNGNMPYNSNGNMNGNMPYNSNGNLNGTMPTGGGNGAGINGNMPRLAQNDGMRMNDNSNGYNDQNGLRDQQDDADIRLNNQNNQYTTPKPRTMNDQNRDGSYGDDRESFANYQKRNSFTANNDTAQIQDKTINSDLRTVLRNDRSLSYDAQNIKIDSQNGTVTLKGFVRNNGEKAKVETLARGVSGVKDVVSNLQIK